MKIVRKLPFKGKKCFFQHHLMKLETHEQNELSKQKYALSESYPSNIVYRNQKLTYRILPNTRASPNRRAPPNFLIAYLKTVAQRSIHGNDV